MVNMLMLEPPPVLPVLLGRSVLKGVARLVLLVLTNHLVARALASHLVPGTSLLQRER